MILDDYIIERELGRGGMGWVWLVRSQSTGRRFAVKQALIHDDKHRKAFLAELQTWIDLPEHPNIVPCRFFRTVGDEIVIFADYVDGGSLADWIAKRKLTSLEKILDVAIQFAWGLHAIHERGLIHQDVKPGNVLMTADPSTGSGRGGVPMVTDFGLARARLRAADGSFVSPALPPGQQSMLVSSGGMTPAYASPEQRAGQPLSRKTDIWSWGVSVLDMFMGGVSCPHGGHIAAEVLENAVNNAEGDDNTLRIPDSIADILRRCFAANPAKRWDDLKTAGASLVCAFLPLTGKAFGRKCPESAVSHVRRGSQDRHISGATWDDPAKWLRRAVAAMEEDEGIVGHILDQPSKNGKANMVQHLLVFEEAQKLFQRAIVTGRPQYRRDLASLLMEKALLLRAANDLPGSVDAYREAIAILQQLIDCDGRPEVTAELAMAFVNLAIALHERGDVNSALALNDRAISLLEAAARTAVIGSLSGILSTAYTNKAVCLNDTGNPDAAVQVYDQVIDLNESCLKRDWQVSTANHLANAYGNKAIARKAMGRLMEASALYGRMIQIREDLVVTRGFTQFTDYLARDYVNKANAERRLGSLPAAIMSYDRAVNLYEHLLQEKGRNDVSNDIAMVYMNKAIALKEMGETDLALDCLDRCVRLRKHLVEDEGRNDLAPDLAWSRLVRAECVLLSGRMSVSEVATTRASFIVVRAFAKQTGRADLRKVVEWAQDVFQEVLCDR